jgi:hypothetical protein
MQGPVVIAQPPGFKGSVKGQVGAMIKLPREYCKLQELIVR